MLAFFLLQMRVGSGRGLRSFLELQRPVSFPSSPLQWPWRFLVIGGFGPRTKNRALEEILQAA
jgi:hypothetical protein